MAERKGYRQQVWLFRLLAKKRERRKGYRPMASSVFSQKYVNTFLFHCTAPNLQLRHFVAPASSIIMERFGVASKASGGATPKSVEILAGDSFANADASLNIAHRAK